MHFAKNSNKPTASVLAVAVAIALLACAPGTVLAQDEGGQDQSAQEPKSDAKESDATESSKEESVSELDRVVVKGFRAALASSQQLKQESDSIIDAVVSEDVGKLPDTNGAEVLARIPGVQIQRSNDEGQAVLLRGLPDVTTTYNNREIFSTNDRKLHFQDFAASAAAGWEVYKSSAANLIEPGIGGLLNIVGYHPLDMKETEIAGELKATYNDQAHKVDPSGNLLVSKRWNTSIGEIGAMVHGSYISNHFRNSVRFNGENVTTRSDSTTPGAGTFQYPDYIGIDYPTGTRDRPSLNSMVQWRPRPGLEFYAEGLWSAYRGKLVEDFFGMSLLGGTASNVELSEPGRASGLTITGGNSPDINRKATDANTDLYQVATGFKWKIDPVTLSGDFAYTDSKYTAEATTLQTALPSTPTYNAQFSVGGTGIFDLGGYDLLNNNNNIWNGIFQSRLVSEGSGYQGRLDLDWDTGSDWLPKIQFGVRATSRDARDHYGDRYAWTREANMLLSDLPSGGLELVQSGLRGGPQPVRTWLEPNGSAILNNVEAIRLTVLDTLSQLVANNPDHWARGWWQYSEGIFSTPDVQYNPTSDFLGKEDTYAGYVQGKYNFQVGDVWIDGLVGVRIAKTNGSTMGISRVTEANGETNLIPRTIRQNYTDILPSFQSRIRFTDELQLRLGYTETRTRPAFSDLNPALTITRNVNDGSNYNGIATSGNPYLKPLTSKNYDASLEYYFAENGYASLAVFYRDLWGFTSSYSTDAVDPVYGLIRVTRPENAGEGRIKGFEASYQKFFDFLPGWLSGFGVQANVTYLDAKNALPATLGVPTNMVELVGVSKWTYNVNAMYEKDRISARLSYNHRGRYTDAYSRDANEEQYTGKLVHPITRVDGSFAYQVSDKFSVVASVYNLFATPYHNYRYYSPTEYFDNAIVEEGRYYSLSLRFKL